MPVRANPQISINPGRQLKDWIAGWAALAGQPLATTAVDLLTDLKATMDRELRLCPLALGEARLLAQIQSGWAPDAKLGPSLAAVVREELDALGGQDHAGQWGVDLDALGAKLDRLGPLGDLALRGALARWAASGDDTDRGGFEAAGIRIVADPDD